jgi:hypothetical protein
MPGDDFISEDTLEALRNIEHALERIEATLEDTGEVPRKIEQALERIEAAIKENGISQLFREITWAIYAIAIVFLATAAWHSKWRYAMQYQVGPMKVVIAKEPHDCDFLFAPIGDKFCEYNRKVSTVRWGRTPDSNQPILSMDDGKTWYPFTPEADVVVPRYSTLEGVSVDWEKKEE